MQAHLLVDISSHGFGHLAQTAPVIAALCDRARHVRLTIRSALSRQRLESYIVGDFAHVPETRDVSFTMDNAVDVNLAASAMAYREFHRQWPDRVRSEAAWLRSHAVNAVLTNVAYLPLAGAANAGIPCASLCSLNWADLFCHYFAAEPWSADIHNEILSAYNAADCFLRVSPGLPMAGLHCLRQIGPIARFGKRDRMSIARDLGIDKDRRWVLVGMGGMDFRLPIESWPVTHDIVWLVPAAWHVQRNDVAAFDSGCTAFADVLASVDAVVTKPGYGIFVEAACQGIPILYVQRDDWPETRYFSEWLTLHARSLALSRNDLMKGEIRRALTRLWRTPAPVAPRADGAAEAASLLQSVLGLG